MKTHFSDPDYVKKVAQMQIQAMQVNPPAIPFRRVKKKEEDEDEVETKKLKIRTDPTDEDSDEIEIRATVFDEGEAEDWIKWRIQFDELVRDMQLVTGRQKIVVAKALLKGNAREKFSNILADLAINRELEVEDDEVGAQDKNMDDDFEEAIEKLGLDYFPSVHAYRRQRNYLRYHVFMMDMTLSDFKAELRRQNNFLKYFPVPDDREKCETLPDDELVEIVDRAKRVEWQRDLLTANIDPYALTLDEYYRYLEKLEVKHNIDKALRNDKKRKAENEEGDNKKPTHKKRARKDKKGPNKGSGNLKRDKACVHCSKWHPAPDDQCWSLKKNKSKKPAPPTERMFTALQMEQIAKALKTNAEKTKKKKRKVSFMAQPGTDSTDNSSNSEFDAYYSFYCSRHAHRDTSVRRRKA